MIESYDDKFQTKELLERVKQLELENESMAERAEEMLLLSILADNISNIDSEIELIEELLEKISVLINLSVCACYIKNKECYDLVSQYISPANHEELSLQIKLSKKVINELENNGVYYNTINDKHDLDYQIIQVTDVEVLIISFKCSWLKEGVFIFTDNYNNYPIHCKELVVSQAIRMVIDRIEKLSHIKQIEQLNKSLEERVEERTNELLEINNKLIDEISERMIVADELVKAKERAQESDKLKSAFLANVSHEIRTPMNAIVGFSEILNGGECKRAEIEQYSRIIYANSLSLLNLINDLLDFSKIEANQLQLRYSKVCLNQVFDDIKLIGLALLNQYNKNNIVIELHKPMVNDKAIVYTDEYRLKQILINLLSNAVKYSFDGKIEISYNIEGIKTFISVKDCGVGIDEKLFELIFDRFSRVSGDLNKSVSGNGLGLTITRNLVEMLGGEISVESTLGKGSNFKFYIVSNC